MLTVILVQVLVPRCAIAILYSTEKINKKCDPNNWTFSKFVEHLCCDLATAVRDREELLNPSVEKTSENSQFTKVPYFV